MKLNRKSNRFSTLSSLAVGVALLATTSSANAIDLYQAWDFAKGFDAQLKSAQAQITANQERQNQAVAANGLQVNGTATIAEQLIDTNKTPYNIFGSPSAGLQLSLPLYRPQNLTAIESSKLQVMLAQTQLVQAQQDLMLRVAQAYFDVLSAQDNLTFLRAQKKAILEQLASAKRNFEVGTATITDQQEAQARADIVQAQEFAAESDLDVKKSALETLCGRKIDVVNGLVGNADLRGPNPAGETYWTEAAEKGSFSVQLAQIATELAKRELERSRLATGPTIDLIGNGNLSRSSASLPGLVSRSASVGVQLSVPIFNGGALDSRQREAIALVDKSENDLLAAKRIAAQSTRSVYKQLGSGMAQVKALQQAEKSSQLALDSNQLGYKVGVRINIDVLNAQQQLFSTRRDLAKARYDFIVGNLRLKQVSAGLTEADLKAVSGLLPETPAR
jgi:outer membrane protein